MHVYDSIKLFVQCIYVFKPVVFIQTLPSGGFLVAFFWLVKCQGFATATTQQCQQRKKPTSCPETEGPNTIRCGSEQPNQHAGTGAEDSTEPETNSQISSELSASDSDSYNNLDKLCSAN